MTIRENAILGKYFKHSFCLIETVQQIRTKHEFAVCHHSKVGHVFSSNNPCIFFFIWNKAKHFGGAKQLEDKLQSWSIGFYVPLKFLRCRQH